MSVITPPLYLTVDAVYTAADLGLPYRDIVSEGIVDSTHYAVSQRGAGANMSVDVAAGSAWVAGDDNTTTQPVYRVRNDATVNLAISAADATNPRIDIVVLEVRDSAFSGVNNDARLRVITGTPAGSPSVPSTPNNCLKLADVSVLAAATSITNARITDKRALAQLGGALSAMRTVSALPTTAYDGQIINYVADAANGIIWTFKYRTAASGSYKWEFIGGPPARSEVTTGQARNDGSYGDLATAGPSFTVPLAGDYYVDLGARIQGTGVFGAMSFSIGASAAVDANMLSASIQTVTQDSDYFRRQKLTIAAASTALVAKYRTSGTVTYTYRNLSILPIRVG